MQSLSDNRSEGFVALKCPSCSSPIHYAFRLGDLTLARCKTCHLLFQPRPVQGLGLYDTPEYYSHWGLKDGFKSVWAMKSSSSLDYLSLVRGQIGAGNGEKPRLLDVGCAYGYVLEMGKILGYESSGVEVSPAAEFAQSRGLPVFKGQLHEAKFQDEYFDLVTMIDVIEHLPDPVAFLNDVFRILKPGGQLLILTPNVDNLVAKALGRRWPHYKAEHLFYYCPHSMRYLLRHCRFHVEYVRRGTKRLNYKYVSGHFLKYSSDWWLTRIVRSFDELIPDEIATTNFKLPTEMLALGSKPEA